MDPNNIYTRSKLYGDRKGHTYEQVDAMRDVEFRAPTPRLGPQPSRLFHFYRIYPLHLIPQMR